MDHETVAAYLNRVGVFAPAAGTRRACAHCTGAPAAVPFENLSMDLAEPISLDERDLIDKIVRRRRGGFCYELNGAFALLLEALGARVSRVAARVYGEAGLSPPFDHLALIVRPADGAGHGSPTWASAATATTRCRWSPGRPDDPAGRFRLADAEAGDIDVLRDGKPQYRLETRERSLADCVPPCWWQQTSPQSHFTRSRSAPGCLRAAGCPSAAGC